MLKAIKEFFRRGINSQIKIFCLYHYQEGFPLFDNKVYSTIQTGCANEDFEFGCKYKDNTGDNISAKNHMYSDLSAYYWIWKNYLPTHPEIKYIGGAHHYRHLDYLDIYQYDPTLCHRSTSIAEFSKVLKKYTRVKIPIEGYDIIMPMKFHHSETVFERYSQYNPAETYLEFEQVCAELYPEYIPHIEKIRNQKWEYLWNLWVMKTELFDDYMNWLFSILFELEKRTNMWSVYQEKSAKMKRIPAYLGERVVNIWLSRQKEIKNIKIAEKGLMYLNRK